jgi:hypothetical protein
MSQQLLSNLIPFNILQRNKAARAEPESPLGKRLVALSLAFHEELMDDDLILDYLDEVIDACNRELALMPKPLPHLQRSHRGLTVYLTGILKLADTIDTLEHHQMVTKVQDLEEDLCAALIPLYMERVA